MNIKNIEEKSFFEYLGLADMEKVHSQFLAWIFSNNCHSINEDQKNKLFRKIFKLKNNSKIEEIHTECNRIDIIFKTNKEIIVVENKIKSSQHSDQLIAYKKYCEEKFPKVKKHYYFLTLIGEHTVEKEWLRISYNDIFKYFKKLILAPNNAHSIIIQQYLIYLEKLVEAINSFKKNPSEYDFVFKDGKKRKVDKIHTAYKNSIEKFIANNQLETIFQKCFLSSLVEQISDVEANVADTRGEALVDFIIWDNISYNGNLYNTLIQLQGDTVKFVFSIRADNYSDSNKKMVAEVIKKMRSLQESKNFGYKKLNEPKTKAYVSLSKKFYGHYWHKNISELARLIKIELSYGKLMTKQLLKLLDKNEIKR